MQRVFLVVLVVLLAIFATVWMNWGNDEPVQEVITDSGLMEQESVEEPVRRKVDEPTSEPEIAETSSADNTEPFVNRNNSTLPEEIEEIAEASSSVPDEVRAEVFTTFKIAGKKPDELSRLFYSDELLAHAVEKQRFVIASLEKNKDLTNFRTTVAECRRHLCRLEILYAGNEVGVFVRNEYMHRLSRHRIGFSVSEIVAYDVDEKPDMAVVYFQPWIFRDK